MADNTLSAQKDHSQALFDYDAAVVQQPNHFNYGL